MVRAIPEEVRQADKGDESEGTEEVHRREVAEKQHREGVMRIADGARRTINKQSTAYKAELDPNRFEPVRELDPEEAIFVTAKGAEEHSFQVLI